MAATPNWDDFKLCLQRLLPVNNIIPSEYFKIDSKFSYIAKHIVENKDYDLIRKIMEYESHLSFISNIEYKDHFRSYLWIHIVINYTNKLQLFLTDEKDSINHTYRTNKSNSMVYVLTSGDEKKIELILPKINYHYCTLISCFTHIFINNLRYLKYIQKDACVVYHYNQLIIEIVRHKFNDKNFILQLFDIINEKYKNLENPHDIYNYLRYKCESANFKYANSVFGISCKINDIKSAKETCVYVQNLNYGLEESLENNNYELFEYFTNIFNIKSIRCNDINIIIKYIANGGNLEKINMKHTTHKKVLALISTANDNIKILSDHIDYMPILNIVRSYLF